MIGKTNALAVSGYKIATGSAATKVALYSPNSTYVSYIQVTGLDFDPIAVAVDRKPMDTVYSNERAGVMLFDPSNEAVIYHAAYSTSLSDNGKVAMSGYAKENYTHKGFVFPVVSGGSGPGGVNFNYIAVGV